ncbi:MAG: heavy metal translocating P-type ATPase [Phreatobacter sp.]|uniref:heavy metal translocating P-type ATPase n=1 Tax=Phreatobacter sp. TaxID=1966341 RepID=UPI0027331496|nr:heavy metal translocating P-type ATPase [Phreatobacter sp.]MDP2800765.1 heavy metal translocating P-type ATPase [Phreatobacter sp.]
MDFAVDGITCAACMPVIEQGLAREPGVDAARVNLTHRRLTVEWREAATTPQRIVERLTAMGFRAFPFDPKAVEGEEAREARFLLQCLGVAGFAMMNIMLLSVSVWSGNVTDITQEQRDFFHWLSALIAVPAVAYAGRPFFRSARMALAARQLNMDVPISLGVLLAVGMSLVETANHATHAYFDSAVMLLFFLLIGRYFEQLMRRKTRTVAANIAALKAETAVKIMPDGALRQMPIAAILAGDRVMVRPGERVAVDGLIVAGRSALDQSLVTGETLPQEVGPGDAIYAGTLNTSGMLTVEVRAAARGTLLDEVGRLLETALEARSSYRRLADRAAALYSPVVHIAAIATLAGWILAGLAWQPALIIAITVLIITCPCALGLAIPAVQVVAAGALFKAHVLLQSGDALERLAAVDTVVFDKTGTLTLPEPALDWPDGLSDEARALAGGLAISSHHPLARAVAAAFPAARPLADASEEPGKGVSAMVDGTEVRLGSLAFCDAAAEGAAVAERHPDASLIAFRYGDLRHVFAVRQVLRPDAVAVVATLRAAGLDIEILSGDRPAAVATVAHTLGIATASGDMKPADKIARLDVLKAAGRRVLMVGDGLNDAPALARAHVSMSPVTAVHLTQAAADAVFLGDRLAPVAHALAVSRTALRLMKENLWIAVVYNAIAVPIAIAGMVTPLIAALAMSGSSVIVTANALRARRGRL